MSIAITGVPTGASLSAGTLAGGVWTLTPAELSGLTITPPTNSDNEFTLTVTSTSTDGSVSASTSQTLAVTVDAVADTPNLTVSPASGDEDTSIALALSASLADTDNSESLSIRISGVTAGAVLSAGADQGSGVWTLTPAQLAELRLITGANRGDDLVLTVTAIAAESDAGSMTSNIVAAYTTLAVMVADIADQPNLSVAAASGNEDTQIALAISASLVDTDNSESLAIRISNVPSGAILSAGTNLGGGVWSLTPAQLTNLRITPPANSDIDFSLTVTATATEAEGGSTAANTATMAVTVDAVADTPNLTVSPASGNEDTAIALSISTGATDPSESVSIAITGVPSGASLSAGTLAGGVWTLTPSELSGLTITPPGNASGAFTLTVVSTSTDGSVSAATTGTLAVTVAAVADAPTLSLSAASGNEDTAIALSISTGATDPSESVSIAITGVPSGASLSAGTLAGGVWTLTPAELSGLTITPPANDDGDFTLTVVSTSTDGSVSASTTGTLAVTVNPVADAPGLTVAHATGNEDTAIALSISVRAPEPSESVSIRITGVPSGGLLSAGSLSGGVWTLNPGELSGLRVTPPTNDDSDFTLTVVSISTDGSLTAATTAALAVSVNPVADAPVLTVAAASGNEDTAIALSITTTPRDPSESLSVRVIGVPSGALLSAGSLSGGIWTLNPGELTGLRVTPPTNDDGDFTLTVVSISTDGSVSASTTGTLAVTVNPVADAPGLTVAPATGNEDTAIALSISTSRADPSETISGVTISAGPSGASLSAGTAGTGGVWTLTEAQLAGLAITPPANSDTDFTLTVVSTSTDGSVSAATTG
ncbi:MAG: beta strand repeat-containing protein, partial [Rhodospirillales bacterium]